MTDQDITKMFKNYLKFYNSLLIFPAHLQGLYDSHCYLSLLQKNNLDLF